MPVFPLVASISVEPGLIVPARSASTIMPSAGRSLTLPAGFTNSALHQTLALPCGATRTKRTSGVAPTKPSAPSATVSPFSVLRRFMPSAMPAHQYAESDSASSVELPQPSWRGL
jgi:hypothetical protein